MTDKPREVVSDFARHVLDVLSVVHKKMAADGGLQGLTLDEVFQVTSAAFMWQSFQAVMTLAQGDYTLAKQLQQANLSCLQDTLESVPQGASVN